MSATVGCIIDVGPFLPAESPGPCQWRTGRVFSLSCVPWRQARVESCSKMLLPFKGEKHESQLVIPLGYFRAAPPLHHCPRSAPLPRPAPFHGWLRTGKRALLGVRTEPAGAKRDFPSLSKHPATSPSLRGAINCFGESAFWGDIDLARWLAAAGTNGASSPLRGSGRLGGPGKREKRVPNVCKCQARWA